MILQFFKRPLKIIKRVFEKCSISKEKKQNFLLVLSKRKYRKYKNNGYKKAIRILCLGREEIMKNYNFQNVVSEYFFITFLQPNC